MGKATTVVWARIEFYHEVQGKKLQLALFSTPAETKLFVLLSASVERFGVSRVRDLKKKRYSSMVFQLGIDLS